MFKKIKKTIKKIVFKFIKPDPVYIKNSFSQAGEDVILDFLFNDVGLKKIKYLELGVMSPDQSNNTYKFYLKGSTGVLVEADSTQIPQIKKMRPNDVVLNVGVSPANTTEADFYIFDCVGLNTFDKEEALYRDKIGTYKIEKVVKVELKNINQIIEENFETYPDFLSIDIEGLDLVVLQSLNLAKYPIPLICAETCTYSENHIKPKDKRIEEFLVGKGYSVYADTYINTIFANNEWFNSFKK